MKTIQNIYPIVVTTVLVISSGCNSADERFVELSETSAERQAEQNVQMSQQSQLVAESARRLIEADAQARREMLQAEHALQQKLQEERRDLDRQHDELEQERRALAANRHRDPLIAGAITSGALLLGCMLPVLVCVFVLRLLHRPEHDDALSELLVREITAENSPLLLMARDVPTAAIAGPTSSPLEGPDEAAQSC